MNELKIVVGKDLKDEIVFVKRIREGLRKKLGDTKRRGYYKKKFLGSIEVQVTISKKKRGFKER